MRALPPRPGTPLGATLTREQKLELYTQGYVILRNYVPKEVVTPALRLINQELGYGLSAEDMQEAAKGSYCKRITSSTPVCNLFNSSPVYGAVRQLISKTSPTYGGQIALRFPGQLCSDREHFIPSPWWSSGWHLDGFSDQNNNIDPGEIKNFTALIGVALSDAASDFCGNLVVYPRSHWIMQQYFRENGFEQCKKGLKEFPAIQLPPPVQVHLNAGDAVIVQYMLAHSIAPNTSPNIRYQVYFRVNARQGDIHHPEPMLNMWQDWDGMKDIVETEKELAPILNSNSGNKPYYVDQRRQQEFQQLLEYDKKLNDLKKQAEALFEAKQWEQGQGLWMQLADHFINDWVIQLKCALCFAFGPESKVYLGEKYCKNLITLSPLIASGYCIYAATLNIQKRYQETVDMAKKVLELPPTADRDGIKGLLEAAIPAMIELKYPEAEMTQYVEGILAVYPQYADLVKNISQEISKKKLWKQGHEWLHSPHKDLVKGESIFSQIIAVDPKDYFATLLYGGCLTWNKKFIEGEAYLKRAIELDPNGLPHGYSVLAQNQLAQGKHENVLQIVREMFTKKFPNVESDNDHKEKIFEALDCVKQVSGLNSLECKTLIDKAKQLYPSLHQQLSHFERTGNKDENCCLQ